MKQLLIISLVIGTFLTACNKDKEKPAPSLKGKWTVENSILKVYSGGTLVDTETQPGNGSTMDFQDNGNCVVTDSGGDETLLYTIMPESKVKIDEDIFEIRSLTATSVTLFLRDDLGSDEYDEIYVNLKR